MRKIIQKTRYDLKTYDPILEIKIRDQDGNVTELSSKITPNDSNRSPEERLQIIAVNELLLQDEQNKMTEEEIEYLLHPLGNPENTVDDLQALAGFTVDKSITYS